MDENRRTNYGETLTFDWDKHYANGGMSGEPDFYTFMWKWKLKILKEYCNMKTDSFIDIACGDLQFWNNELPKNYTGIDISPSIIQKNKNLFPDTNFIISNAASPLNLTADNIICFNVLYHIIDDDEYKQILINLKNYSNKYIFIFAWNRNPLRKGIIDWLFRLIVGFKKTRKLSFPDTTTDNEYIKYRNFLKIATPIFASEFKLIAEYTHKNYDCGTMYIYRKKENYA